MSSQHIATAAAATAVTTAETVVATIVVPPFVSPVGDGLGILALISGTFGAGTTGVILRIRQDSITGADISYLGGVTIPATASAVFALAVAGLATNLNLPNGRTFVVTLQQVAATGNATGLNAYVSSTPATPLVG